MSTSKSIPRIMQRAGQQSQRGSVLIMGLVVVMVLSILVLSASQSAVFQLKMTGNLRDKDLAFQAAESGLKAGESYLKQATQKELAGIFDGKQGLFTYDRKRQLKNEADWKELGAVETYELTQVRQKPAYIIEELPDIKTAGDSLAVPQTIDGVYYRVTSKSKGGTDASFVVLQSMYKK